MLLSVFLSILISACLVNFGLSASAVLLSQGEIIKDEIGGKVLGVSEQIFITSANQVAQTESSSQLGQVVNNAVARVSQLPLPELPQPPQLDQPMMRLPLNSVKGEENQAQEPDLSASNAAVLDCQNNSLLLAKRPDRSWPIASITKLATALVFLDYNPGWEKIYQIKEADRRDGGKIYLFTGEQVKVKDLFHFSLIGSDNTATIALVNSTGLSEEQFVAKMNDKMQSLGLKNTRFKDPAGLDDNNISTAREIALLTNLALAKNEISQASLTKKYEFITRAGRKKIIYNTNVLLDDFPQQGISLLGGKTGHINAAGYCLVSKFTNNSGQEIVTVVLGAANNSARFDQTKKLVDLVYNNQSF